MPPLSFDPETTVEEIVCIGRHPRFDAVIDDMLNGPSRT